MASPERPHVIKRYMCSLCYTFKDLRARGVLKAPSKKKLALYILLAIAIIGAVLGAIALVWWLTKKGYLYKLFAWIQSLG